MDLRKQYKKTLVAIGATLLLWLMFFNLFMLSVESIRIYLDAISSSIAVEIAVSILYDAAYHSCCTRRYHRLPETRFYKMGIFFRRIYS